MHRHFRSGRDEHDHPDRRREHGFHSYGRHHRPGRRERHRHGRFPGSRYRRRHLSGGQAFVPRHPRAGHSARADRGALHRTLRPSGTGGGGRHQDRADRRDVLFLAAAHDSAGLQPDHQGARSRAVRRGEAVRAVVPSGAVRRRRRGAFRRGRAGRGAGRCDRRSDRHHPSGARHRAGFQSEGARHARHAWHDRGDRRRAALRPAGRDRRTFRRPRHRQARRVRV